MKKSFLLIFITLLINTAFTQNTSNDNHSLIESIYHNWYNKSPVDDHIYGAEIDKAYSEFLNNKKSTTVIVAVIDGGIDIDHKDLKNNIWINNNEIADNGIDDDNNGYIDDINGWNFLGNDKGELITYENLEVTRIYRQYKSKYENIDPNSIPLKEKDQYNQFTKAKEKFIKYLEEAKKSIHQIEAFEQSFNESYDTVCKYLNKDTLVLSDLENIKTEDKDFKLIVEFLYVVLLDGFDNSSLDEMKTYVNEELNYHLNLEYNPRLEIIGDDPLDISETYGNNIINSPETFHGTFVAGIIGAERNNGIGINGIANDVKIMCLKTVPNGDERDKDVAKAIRYAADNGAKIINMSFGKEMSPEKFLVDEAIKYAESKGVLLVHAAGNDGYNIDITKQYPTKNINDNYNAQSWITVGASSMNMDLDFVADFTNYGKNVDLFAPGVNIKSLAPGNNYDIGDGTSFSSPVVSGVAALLMSYYPELDAKQIKWILLNSATYCGNKKVYQPGDYSLRRKKVKFKNLSKTGRLINAYNAIKMAEELYK